jgi:xanthine/uracil permease
MRKVWKATKIILPSVVGLIVVVVGATLGYRAYVQHVKHEEQTTREQSKN